MIKTSEHQNGKSKVSKSEFSKIRLSIGSVAFDNPFLMAPLAGITDAPTRLIYSQMGAALVYSEMVSAKGLFYGDRKAEALLNILPDEKQVAYQIFGSDPDIMAMAAEKLDGRRNVILDVNMGCPVPKVFKNGDGAALMKNPELIYKVISKMTSATEKPVTAKIRLGVNENSINCVEVAQAIEAGGGAGITVHGRTREQYYSGMANREQIRNVKSAINIPVVANGDVFSVDDCRRIMDETDCDMVMIARGALGNPWIFENLRRWFNLGMPEEFEERILAKEEVSEMMIHHFEELCKYKGERVGINEMRKHFQWYTKGFHGSSRFRRDVNRLSDKDEILRLIEEFGSIFV